MRITASRTRRLARPGKQRDLDAAAGLGMQSIDLAESLNSTRGADCLRDLYYQLRPHSTVPALQDFIERARGFVRDRGISVIRP
ncbi:MAG: hypothetical protein ACRDS9_16270 [Pseudonocardiaceae bacterium]